MRAPYDGPDAEFVALVNESFVRTQLGGADPIDVIVRQSRVVNRSGDTREIQTRIVCVVECSSPRKLIQSELHKGG